MNIYEDATKLSQQTMDNTLKSVSVMTKGLQQIATETSEYAKRAYEQQSSMFEKLASAKTLDKSIEVQTAYAKSAYQEWVSQATRMGEIYTDLAKEAYKPFEGTMAIAGAMGEKVAKETVVNAEKATDKAIQAAEKKAA